MAGDRLTEAPFPGASFVGLDVGLGVTAVALLLGGIFASPAAPAAEPGCPPIPMAERVTADHVYDGDTIRLADGRKVRLVGIDTPELGRDGEPAEPLAESARDRLRRLVPPGTRLGLAYDAERRDRYRRTLAHLFLADGVNLQLVLLERGLATAFVVPPRRHAIRCYAAAEARARASRRGIWALDRYRTAAAEDLPQSSRGFRIVRGTVERVGRSRRAIWLNLAPHMALRVPREDLRYFETYDPAGLKGHRVIGRGWLYRRNGELRMTIRHPAALRDADRRRGRSDPEAGTGGGPARPVRTVRP